METTRIIPHETATDEPVSPVIPADAEEPPSERRDAFTPGRKAKFLDVLGKTGCLIDACRKTGISRTTAYNHQRSDPGFRRQCDLAVHMAGTSTELTAWERAVVGVEEDVIQYGKFVGTCLRRSDSLLRFLLQGAKPKKYGPRAGFTRKRLLKQERKRIEEEVRAEISASFPPVEQVRERIIQKVMAIKRHEEPKKLAAGWTRTEGGEWVPPGWVPAEAAREMNAGDVGWPANVDVSVSTSSTSHTSSGASPEGDLSSGPSDD